MSGETVQQDSGQEILQFRYLDEFDVAFDKSAATYTHKTLERTKSFLEAELLEDSRRFLNPGDCVIDAGAHVGNHTIFFAKIAQCRVLAFEPDAENFASLSASVQLNDVVDRVDLRQAGLGRAKSHGRVIDGPTATASTKRVELCEDGGIDVIPIDELDLEGTEVSVIKIDVEGSELDVLKGARSLIRRDKPRIYVECLQIEDFIAVSKFLAPLGYRLASCFSNSPTFAFSHPKRKEKAASDDAFAKIAIIERNKRTEEVRHYGERVRSVTALNDKLRSQAESSDAKVNKVEASLVHTRALLAEAEKELDQRAEQVKKLQSTTNATNKKMTQISAWMNLLEGELSRLKEIVNGADSNNTDK